MNLESFQYRVALLGVAVAMVLVAGCQVKTTTSSTSTSTTSTAKSDADQKSPKSEKAPATITAEGSSTVYPICQAFAVRFEKSSKSKVSVSSTGTGSGYKKFVIRQADIWNASRPIHQKEIDELKEKGIGWLELNIAIDGIVVAVNSENSWCNKLTCAQLKQIWEPDSKVKTWRDLDPAWPAEELVLFGADTESGTFEYFTEAINDKKGAINTKYTPSSNDNVLVQGISSNKNALGFIPFGYYVENTEKTKAVSISKTKDATATPDPFVEPTVETILGGEYLPLARPLFMYANKDAAKSRPEIAEFLRFAVSKEAQPLVEKKGFVRVTENVREDMAKRLEDSLVEQSVTKNE